MTKTTDKMFVIYLGIITITAKPNNRNPIPLNLELTQFEIYSSQDVPLNIPWPTDHHRRQAPTPNPPSHTITPTPNIPGLMTTTNGKPPTPNPRPTHTLSPPPKKKKKKKKKKHNI